jgi:hypothetical protein
MVEECLSNVYLYLLDLSSLECGCAFLSVRGKYEITISVFIPVPCKPLLQQLPVDLTAGDRPEALLPCCVPYLKLDPLIIQQDLLDLEIYPVPTESSSRGSSKLSLSRERGFVCASCLSPVCGQLTQSW